jgi:hypothetical protein
MNNSEAQSYKNQGAMFEDSYCNNCGQQKQHRLALSPLYYEVLPVITLADKGFS